MIRSEAQQRIWHQRQRSTYLTMSDGVQLAVDIWLPFPTKKQDRFPVILELTRYWREFEGAPDKERVLYFNQHGYGYACFDVRGSGASTGFRRAEIGVEEVNDFAPIIDWLASQPWCNGAVVTQGISYVGNTAEIAMFEAPTALKATCPQFTDFDLYAFLLFPGGLPNMGFLNPWSESVLALDLNCPSDSIPVLAHLVGTRVKPVGSDSDGGILVSAIQDHQKNIPVTEQLCNIVYRDDFESEIFSLEENKPYQWVSPYQLRNNARWQEIPSFHWGSFADAGTAAGVIARFMCSSAPMRAVVGYWSHGLNHDANPFTPKDTPVNPDFEQCCAVKEAFLRPLKQVEGQDIKLLTERALYYFTAGQDVWKKTDTWPPVGVQMECWYLSENARLAMEKPENEEGVDKYTVNFGVGTGAFGRWYQMDTVYYGDRAEADKLLLTYTSLPLEHDIEVTGHPVVNLYMASSESDGAVIVYLESVAPDGQVTMLTEGNLRLLHRKISSEEPPYPTFGPYHTFKKQDAEPMADGQTELVELVMLPLSVQIKKGHAIRIAIAGHDKDYFKRIPENGTPDYSIFRQKSTASHINLPVNYSKKSPLESPFMFDFLSVK